MCYHGIVHEFRLELCPEGQVSFLVLPAAAVPQHWTGFLAGVSKWLFVQMKHFPEVYLSLVESTLRGLWEPFNFSYEVLALHHQERWQRCIKHRHGLETYGCSSRIFEKNTCSTIRTWEWIENFKNKIWVKHMNSPCPQQLKDDVVRRADGHRIK